MLDEKKARLGLWLVFFILLMDMMGIALIMPVMPAFLKELTGADVSHAVLEGSWLFIAYSGMQFLFGAFIGNLSDRFGRRPILLASVFTFALDNLICALAGSYGMLFVGRILAGISGASYATASAYIADISNDENRSRNFGLVGISFGVGFTLGPVIGGFLGEFGPRVPFYAAAGIAFLNFAIALVALPETLPASMRRPFDLRRANPLGGLLQLRNYKGIGWIATVMVLFWLAHVVYPIAWPFVADYRYGWSQGMIGLSLGAFGVMSALVMGLALPRIVKRYGDWRAAIIGLFFCMAGFFGYAFAWEGWMVFAIIFLCCLESITDPVLRAISAAGVHPSQQGELQGTLTSLSSVTSVVGPYIFSSLFSGFTGPSAPIEFPGAPYAAAGLMCVMGLVIFVLRVRPPEQGRADGVPTLHAH